MEVYSEQKAPHTGGTAQGLTSILTLFWLYLVVFMNNNYLITSQWLGTQ